MEREKEKSVKKIIRKKGGNPNPIVSKSIVKEIAKTTPQRPLSKNSLLHKFA